MELNFEKHCWAEIDLDALRRNYERICQNAKDVPVCAVVKADAYGHGDVAVAKALSRCGAQWLSLIHIWAAVLIVCLARLCLKRAPRWISYLLWFAVLFRLLCPVSFTASFSLIPASLSSGSLVESWQDDYLGNTVILHEGASDAYDQAVAAGRQPVYGSEGGHYVVTQEDLVSEPSTVSDTLLPLLSRLWLAGFAGMAGCGLVSYIRLRKKLAGCPVLEDQVFLCSHIPTPFVMGIFRPRIYLPAYLSEEERQYILLHERHHIRRGDPLTRILFYLALCLHWFNPLVWLAFVLSGRDMEVSCDEAVIRKLGPGIRADYAGSLLRFAAGGRIPGPFSPAFGENAAKERIRNLARWSRPTAGLLAAGEMCIRDSFSPWQAAKLAGMFFLLFIVPFA